MFTRNRCRCDAMVYTVRESWEIRSGCRAILCSLEERTASYRLGGSRCLSKVVLKYFCDTVYRCAPCPMLVDGQRARECHSVSTFQVHKYGEPRKGHTSSTAFYVIQKSTNFWKNFCLSYCNPDFTLVLLIGGFYLKKP